jgi:heme-degrading monooxygenase HmoA
MIVVLFSIAMRDDADVDEESAASDRMWSIVSAMPGFISYKAYTADDGETIAVVRFESREALDAWKRYPEHRERRSAPGRSGTTSTGCRQGRRFANTALHGQEVMSRSPVRSSSKGRVRYPNLATDHRPEHTEPRLRDGLIDAAAATMGASAPSSSPPASAPPSPSGVPGSARCGAWGTFRSLPRPRGAAHP